MGKMQRRKGGDFERAVAVALRPVFAGAHRGIGQTRSAGEVPDVDKTPYWIECKHRRVVNIRAAMRQAREETDGRPPVVVSRVNAEPMMVTMLFDDWLALLRTVNATVAVEVMEIERCTNATLSG
jgi:hypothetical protein